MPENYTVTYSETVQGWPSFYSYFPDFILGMNQYLYTFKQGNLYRHNTNNIRNRYYEEDYDSTLTGVFNQEPTTVKVFKTIELESDDSWDINITTDLGAGFMPAADFALKEGSFFAFIKRISGSENLALRSTQGIGTFVSTTGASPGTITVTFNSRVSNMICIGDELNFSLPIAGNTYSNPTSVGEVTAITSDRLTLSVDATNFLPLGSVIPANAYILVLKDPVAESYGATGYYLEFKITNDNQAAVELFTVDSEVFKSNP